MDIEDQIVETFISDKEEENVINIEPLNICKQNFTLDKIIGFMQEKCLLKKTLFCPICNKIMKITDAKDTVDKIVWRCRSTHPNHDVKTNIRTGSVFENIKVPINTLYYMTFYCFIKNYSIRKTFIEMERFCYIIEQPKPNNCTIIKIFRILRNNIKKYYHNYWNNNLLGMEPAEEGLPRIEIDEREVIGNSQKILWRFGLIDRSTKEARIYSVMENRRKENLLPLVKNNVYTYDIIEDNIDNRTRIYSDCYSVYRQDDFNAMGFLLHRVNHSILFGQGMFHTNTVEGLWACIKRITNNFNGLNFNILSNIEKEGINASDYIDDWLCYALFIRDVNRKNLNEDEARNFLYDI